MPQETSLAFDYTVLEIVLMGRYPHLGAFEIEGPADIGIARDALTGNPDEELGKAFAHLIDAEPGQRFLLRSQASGEPIED